MPTRLVSSSRWAGLRVLSGSGLILCRPRHKVSSPSNLIRLASDLDHWTVLRRVTGQSLTFLTATAALASASRIAARPPNRHAVLAGAMLSSRGGLFWCERRRRVREARHGCAILEA